MKVSVITLLTLGRSLPLCLTLFASPYNYYLVNVTYSQVVGVWRGARSEGQGLVRTVMSHHLLWLIKKLNFAKLIKTFRLTKVVSH